LPQVASGSGSGSGFLFPRRPEEILGVGVEWVCPGVTAGLDFGLTMVAELRDRTYAECCQLMDEYDPDPPLHSGSMKTAPPEVKAAMVQLLADFVKKFEALAAAAQG